MLTIPQGSTGKFYAVTFPFQNCSVIKWDQSYKLTVSQMINQTRLIIFIFVWISAIWELAEM